MNERTETKRSGFRRRTFLVNASACSAAALLGISRFVDAEPPRPRRPRSAWYMQPLSDVWDVVFQNASETIGEAHFIADHAAARCDQLCEGTHLGALGGEGGKSSAMRQQEFELEFGVRGIVLGVAGSKGFTVSREGPRIDGKEHEEVILAECRNDGALVALKADGNGLPLESRAQGTHPLGKRIWLMFEHAALTFLGACGLQADIVFGVRPVETDEGCKLICR